MISHTVMADLIFITGILLACAGALLFVVVYKITASSDGFDEENDDFRDCGDDLYYGDFDTSFLTDDARLGSIADEKHHKSSDK